MPWTQEGLLGRTLHDLLRLRVRAERVQLAHKLRVLEAQVRAQGGSVDFLKPIQAALAAHPLLGRDMGLRVRPAPPVTADTPIRRIAVRVQPGSPF